MPQAAFSVGSELVDAVLVGSYPEMIVLVDEHAGGAVVTNQVMIARTEAHVAEVVEILWLHEHAFLHHAEPDVALLVFDDVLHLALRQIGLRTEERIGIDHLEGRVIEGDAFSVAADEEAVVLAGVNGLDREVADLCNLGETPCAWCHLIDTLSLGGKIERTLAILSDVLRQQSFGARDVRLELAVLVKEEQFVSFADNPKSATLVFQEGEHKTDFALGSLERSTVACLLFHQEDAVARSTDENIAVLLSSDVGHISRDGVALAVGKGNIQEVLTIVEQQSSVGAEKYVPIVILCDAVDVVGVQLAIVIASFLYDAEVVAIVNVKSIAGGNPDKTIGILIHLCSKITG